jgi:hypothetical protein
MIIMSLPAAGLETLIAAAILTQIVALQAQQLRFQFLVHVRLLLSSRGCDWRRLIFTCCELRQSETFRLRITSDRFGSRQLLS